MDGPILAPLVRGLGDPLGMRRLCSPSGPRSSPGSKSARQAADDELDAAAMDLAAMLGRGPNQGDWNSLGSAGVIPSAFYGSVEGGAPGEPGGPGFVIGPPTRPDIEWDEDFEYDSASAGFSDHLARLECQAKLRGGQLLKPGLDDATAMYQHYWDNNGDPIEFDYEEGYNEDSGIRLAVDNEIARAQQGAEALIRAGNTCFSMNGRRHRDHAGRGSRDRELAEDDRRLSAVEQRPGQPGRHDGDDGGRCPRRGPLQLQPRPVRHR